MSTKHRLKELRERLGLSMRGICEEIGLSCSTFSYYESGKRLPSIETCYKIIEYAKGRGVNVSIEWLRPNDF